MQVTCVIAIALLCISSVFSAPATNDQLALNDVRVLQYALTLEHIEAFFYTQGQAKWTAADFQSIGLTSADYAYFEVIKNHEVAHVQFLQNALTAAKQTPVTACSNYNFAALGADPFASVAAYISIAAALENAGVSAYGGAITSITNKDFVTAAATIHSVEARHAQYVNRLVNKTDTSSFVSFQPTVPPTGVAQIVTALNQTCAAKLTGLPSNLFDGPAADANQFSYTSFKDAAGANIYKPALDANDINLLQYALYLENFEAAFYDYFVGSGSTSFNAGQFTGAGYSSEVYTYLTLVRSHEIAHVDTLKTFITGLKATPVFPCIYNFSSIDSVPKFVSTAATIEPVGVSAYNGGANTATNRFQVLAAAASIVAVEARHASILAIFADQVGNATAFSPFPSTFDPAQRPADIRAAVLATGLLIELDGCAPAQLPVVYTQTSNYTTGTTTTGSTSVSTSTSGRASGGTTGANTASSLATVSALVMMIVVAVMYL